MLSRKDVNKMWTRFKMRARRKGMKIGFKKVDFFTPERMEEIDIIFAGYYGVMKPHLFPHILFDKREGVLELCDVYISNSYYCPEHFRKKPITIWSRKTGVLMIVCNDINEAAEYVGISAKQIERNAKLQNSHPKYFIRYGNPELLIGVKDGELTVNNVKVGKTLLTLFISNVYGDLKPDYGTGALFECMLRRILKADYLHRLAPKSPLLVSLEYRSITDKEKAVTDFVYNYVEVCNG